MSSGLNGLSAVTLVDIIRPFRKWRQGRHNTTDNRSQDERDTKISKILSKHVIKKKSIVQIILIKDIFIFVCLIVYVSGGGCVWGYVGCVYVYGWLFLLLKRNVALYYHA